MCGVSNSCAYFDGFWLKGKVQVRGITPPPYKEGLGEEGTVWQQETGTRVTQRERERYGKSGISSAPRTAHRRAGVERSAQQRTVMPS